MGQPMKRRPVHPGEIILADVMTPLGLTRTELAKRLGLSTARVSAIVSGKQRVSADIAMRLAKLLGTGPEVWLNLQQAVDLWDARQSADLTAIKPRRRKQSAHP